MITIKIEEYDAENKSLIITKGEKNLFGLVSIMQFEEEMEYFGISIVKKSINGKRGYIFSKNEDENLVFEETKRFLNDHNVENLDAF